MWIILGIVAIIATFINIYQYRVGKNYQLAMAMALSFTALTLVAEYRMVSNWVKAEDWAALLDVVPAMETTLWILTLVSLLLNLLPLFLEMNNKN